MDELKRLEREVKDLQWQLKQQNEEAERARNRLIEENRRNLNVYQAEMQRAIKEHDNAAKSEYERLLREYEYSISDEAGRKLAEIDSDYNRILTGVRRSEEELARKNQELQEAVQALRGDISKREEGSRAQAQEYLQNAVAEFREIEAKPHEKFMPKRLAVFYNAIKDAQQLLKSGMFEAATAVAISARSGLERLGYNIDDKATEWDKQFDLLSFKLHYLRSMIKQELDDWKQYIGQNDENCDSRRNRLIEINYWSRGEYAAVVMACNRINAVISDVEKEGKAAYFKRPDGATTDDLKQFIQEVDGLNDRLTAMSVIDKSRYAASCKRAEWGECIIDFFTDEINLRWIDELSGFREVSPEAAATKEYRDYIQIQFGDDSLREDTREWLKLVFENASGNRIYVYILPIESKGRVDNKIILHIDFGGAEQPQYSRDIYAHICEAISLDEEDKDNVILYTPDVNELKANANKAYKETAKDLEQLKRENN